MITRRLAATLSAAALASGLMVAAPAAHAQWRPGFYGPGFYHRGPGPVGAVVGGALLGLGVGALLAPPAYYRPPPPVVYAPPAYYPAPVYRYAPAPYYYAPPY